MSKESLNRNVNKALAAKQRGLKVVEPRANEVQIDLDGLRAIRHYADMYGILKREGLTRGWKDRLSRSASKNHVHVTITLPFRDAVHSTLLERIGLAAILGDDPARAAFNWSRVKLGADYPVIFFEKGKKNNPQ